MGPGHYPEEQRLQQGRKRRALALTYSEEPVLKEGLKDKIKGARKDLFELEQQARVPDSNKRLSDVKKDTPAILSSPKGKGNGIRDAEALLDSLYL
jgi:hypothetical protein